jgi:hypothetical protein
VAKAPKTTLWKLEPHSRAKHAILARYLHGWTPILTRGGHKTIAYIDGFAGPGRYEGGEDGSPIIALKAALRHRAHITGKVLFLFVEEQQDRADHLQRLVDVLPLPPNVAVKVEGGKRFCARLRRISAAPTCRIQEGCRRRSPSSIRSAGHARLSRSFRTSSASPSAKSS